MGSIIVIQPLLCTGLLFALPIGAAWQGRRLGRGDWIGAIALTAGLAVFLVVGNPTEGKDFATTHAWVLAAAVLGPVIVVCIVAGMRTRDTRPGACSSRSRPRCIYSLTAVLTKSAVTELGEGAQAFFTSWEPYAGVALGARRAAREPVGVPGRRPPGITPDAHRGGADRGLRPRRT